MDKDFDLNLSEDNNFSNDELQDSTSFTDYSMSIDDSSAHTPLNGVYQANNSYYMNSKFQTNPKDLMGNVYLQQGSSTANGATSDTFRQYLDELMEYMCKNNPQALHYFLDNIDKYRNGEMDTGRTTPLLFHEMHALVKLDFPGLIYQLKPNSLSHSGGIVVISDEIYPKIESLGDEYPGPLTPDRTTEDQIYYYLNEQLKSDLEDTSPLDWDSGNLLLKYLELLIKENGKPRISNVVKLLNDGVDMRTVNLKRENKQFDTISRNSFSRASSRATSRASSRAPSPENNEFIDPDLPQNALDSRRGPGSVASVMRRAVNTASQEQKLYQNMDKFREYIWSGRFEEAINFAIRAEIWDHAFALALRMNNAALVNEILVRFSRRSICSNDPLFTMHELMAGKPPRIVASNRGFSNSEMGDWRSHLSMIVAVKKFRPEESRQAIESMGEKLLLLRNFFGAHLCFLLADTPFGVDKSVRKYRRKYDLLGWYSSTSTIPAQKSTYEYCHHLFSGLKYWQSAPELYIKLTEVYEYSLRLRDDESHRAVAVHLLPYKYLMAIRMFDRQQTKTAYEYCRTIGDILGYQDFVWLKCESVTFQMVATVRSLSYKLHSLLTADEDSVDNHVITDISWLNNIDSVYCQLCQKYQLYNPMATSANFFLSAMINSSHNESVSECHSQIGQDRAQTPIYQHTEHTGTSFYPTEMLNREVSSRNFSTPIQRPLDHQFVQQPQLVYPSMINNSLDKPQPVFPSVSSNFRPHSMVTSQPQSSYQFMQQSPQSTIPISNYQVGVKSSETISNVSQIPPPSELPTDMLTRSPPSRRVDHRDSVSSQYHVTSGAQQSSQVQYEIPSIFMPGINNDHHRRDSVDTVDYFVTDVTRSRSQSNGSVASVDNGHKSHSHSRSRHSSESKELKLPPPPPPASLRPLQSTKEEIDHHKHKAAVADHRSTSEEKKKPWNVLGWLAPKSAHLPEDTKPNIEWDPIKNRWIDKSNPEEDRPPTPPPLMPRPLAPDSSSSFKSPASVYQGPSQSVLSKYRQAGVNVKPSGNVSAPALPAFILPPTMTRGNHGPSLSQPTDSNHNEPTNLANGISTHDTKQRHHN